MKRRDLKRSVLTIVLLSAVSVSNVVSASAPRDLEQVFEKLRQGSRVRIYLQKQGRIEGRFRYQKQERVVVSEGSMETAIGFAQIVRVELRKSNARTGAKKGVIILGILGVGGGLYLNEICRAFDESGNSEGCPNAIFILGALGASAGGLIGAGIDAASSKWQVIYERK